MYLYGGIVLLSLYLKYICHNRNYTNIARFEVFTTMEVQVVVFWVMMPCSDVILC
jgi:hypothetical protein